MGKKIGIISENYRNDGIPIAELLQRYFDEPIEFLQFCKDFKGDRIETEESLDDLAFSFEFYQPDFVLVIRDLDNDKNRKSRHTFFEKCKTVTNDKAQHLLLVYMIEALAIIDFETTEKHYNKTIKYADRPSNNKSAKESLQNLFGYKESDMRSLVAKFDTNILIEKYAVWRDFIQNIQPFLIHNS